MAVEVQVALPGLERQAPRVTVWVSRPFRVEDPVEAAYLAAREAYVEALGRQAGLEVFRDADVADGVYLGVAGDPDRVGNFLLDLARAGIGRLTVGIEGSVEPGFLARIGEASWELRFDVADMDGEGGMRGGF